MKQIFSMTSLILLTACQTYIPKQYVSNMYAKGTLNDYENTGAINENNTNCPGCHVKHFDRAKITVTEILNKNTMGDVFVDACRVTVSDSLELKNISEIRYIPVTDELDCLTIFEKEQSYLKAMGFSE